MDKNNIIETIGSITKMEILESIRHKVINGSLVLKNILPFPCYNRKNDGLNLSKNLVSIFILLRYPYSAEQINRIFKELVRVKIIKCYPSYGEITISGIIYPCIRLKNLDNYDLIPYIQQFFQKNNLEIMNYKDIEGLVVIKIFKAFHIIKIAEGLYLDTTEKEKVYIRIPGSMNWHDFDTLTKKIKITVNNSNFDGALGAIYRFYGSEDVIRIYDKEMTFEKAQELKLKYLNEIKGVHSNITKRLQFQ